MKATKVIILMLCCICIKATAQKNQKIIDFINNIPTIQYGELPYWHGISLHPLDNANTDCFMHGRLTHDIKDTYNALVRESISDSSYHVVFNVKKMLNQQEIAFEHPTQNQFGSFRSTAETSSHQDSFQPVLFASAKSLFNETFYVVYFWRAAYTTSAYYFALVFNLDGQLLSYHDFDYWVLDFPIHPFDSQLNKVRACDYPKRQVSYLPNGMIYSKDCDIIDGGGCIKLSYLNEDGHYEVIKSWEEIGVLEQCPTVEQKYINYKRKNEDGEYIIKIPFVVRDKDGFANIRTEANANSKVIRTIGDGDMVWGIYLPNGWCKIDFTADSHGQITEGGYIHSSRLEKISDPTNDEFIKLPSKNKWETIW